MMPIYNKSCRGLTGHERSQFIWNPQVSALPTSTVPLKQPEQNPPAQTLLLEFILKAQESSFCLAGICSSNTANLISTIFLQSSGAYHLAPCLEIAVALEDILTLDIRTYHTEDICYLSVAFLLQVSLLNINDKWHLWLQNPDPWSMTKGELYHVSAPSLPQSSVCENIDSTHGVLLACALIHVYVYPCMCRCVCLEAGGQPWVSFHKFHLPCCFLWFLSGFIH